MNRRPQRYPPLLLLALLALAVPVFGADGGPPIPHPLPKGMPLPPPRARGSAPPPRQNAPHGPAGKTVPFMEKLEGYKRRLKQDPDDIEALVFLANANFDIQRFETAEKLYLRALEVDPDNVHIRTDLASAYRNLGNSAKAVETLRGALKINPNHEVALYNLGVILLNDRGDPRGAADAWERLIRINPNDPLADSLREKIRTIREGKLRPN